MGKRVVGTLRRGRKGTAAKVSELNRLTGHLRVVQQIGTEGRRRHSRVKVERIGQYPARFGA
jgi:hypothetical protein